MKSKWKYMGGSFLGIAIVGGVFTHPETKSFILSSVRGASKAPTQNVELSSTSTSSIPTETVLADQQFVLGSTLYSWPGEIVSQADVEIYPSREGHIAEWDVQIGEHVRKGQRLGRLSPQPANLELASALAERAAAITRAKAKLVANEKYAEQARKRLANIKKSLVDSRDAAIKLTERDAIRDQRSSAGAESERIAERESRDAAIRAAQIDLEQARVFIPIKRQTARLSIERLSQRLGGRFSITGTNPTTPNEALVMEFRSTIGVLSASLRDTYRRGLAELLKALKDPQALPEAAVQAYAQAGLQLLSQSVVSEELTANVINEMRTDLTDDQKDFYDALRDFKDSQKSVAIKEASMQKLVAERARDVAAADTQALVAKLTAESSETYKQKAQAEAQVEFTKEQAELDATLSDLERAVTLARGEVEAAEVAYGSIAAGVTGQDIFAPMSGIVSTILRKNGEHVSAEIAVASLTQHGNDTKFVRFHIPSNIPKPESGTEILIERPGFSLEKMKGSITGIGLSLDDAGSYMAEAVFDEETDWPTHASVRVSLAKHGAVVTIPLSAVWWSEDGKPQTWVAASSTAFTAQAVTVGRVVGDRVEILEGLKPGIKYLPAMDEQVKKQATFLREGGTPVVMDAADTKDHVEGPPSSKKKIGTDMHGGGHEE